MGRGPGGGCVKPVLSKGMLEGSGERQNCVSTFSSAAMLSEFAECVGAGGGGGGGRVCGREGKEALSLGM